MHAHEYLRLHVEAVWGISVPALHYPVVELAVTRALPPWTIYQGTIDTEQITIWRPLVSDMERAAWLEHVQTILASGGTDSAMRREVILRRTAPARIDLRQAQSHASLLTNADVTLLTAFAPGEGDHYLQPRCAPCVGVALDGQLVSLAHSARRTADACELGIDTLLSARRQGFALAATVLWATMVEQEGLLPIYSAYAENTASLRLAAAAGYTPVAHSIYGPVTNDEE